MLIFTDGSFTRKPKMGGMGAVLITDNNKCHEFGAYSNKCNDNNVTEIAAIAMAIHYIKQHKVDQKSKDKTITIISDSQYAVRKIRQNCEGKDEFEDKCLSYIRNFLEETNKKVSFLQIKGHVHDNTKFAYYNNVADDVAREYRLKGLERQQKRFQFKQSKDNSR